MSFMGMSPQSYVPNNKKHSTERSSLMKKILVLAAAIALVSSTAFAAGTATLTVTANVQGTCLITDGTLPFGLIDSIAAPAVGPIAAAGVTVTCNNGTIYSVTDDAAANPLTNGTDNIPFTLAHAGGGTATGVADAYAITGSIAAGAYLGFPAGAYTSSVTLTVTP
jgi:spore coat protein U-like protein